VYADRDNGPTPSPFPILPPYLPPPDRMAHHDRTATAIRSTTSISSKSIHFLVCNRENAGGVRGDGRGVEEKVAERKKGNLGFEDFLSKSRWTI